jgi:hypothetical protein
LMWFSKISEYIEHTNTRDACKTIKGWCLAPLLHANHGVVNIDCTTREVSSKYQHKGWSTPYKGKFSLHNKRRPPSAT